MKYGIGLAQAFRTLSVFNVPGKDACKSSSSLVFYPVAGCVLGIFASVLPFLAVRFLNIDGTIEYLVLGSVFTFAMVLLTRGFHLDGLGDMADGFFGAWEKEKILEYMSNSLAGSFSVVAISSVLIIKALSFGCIFANGDFVLAVLCTTLSRTMAAILCCISHYAKEKGLSHDLVENAGWFHFVLVVTVMILICIYPVLYFCLKFEFVLCFCVSFIVMLILFTLSYKKIGGITGDILGACVELTEAACALAAAFI